MAKARPKNEKLLSKRKSKRRVSRSTPEASGGQSEDAMSRCVALCQEERWREAALLCRQMYERAHREGKADLYVSLAGALLKIEYSLRRQMAATLVCGAENLLKEEYLLDVG